MIPLFNQLLIIIHCFIIGLFLGVTYDSLSIILKKKNIIIRYLIELGYWFLIVYLITKYIINNINYNIRIYTIVFFIIGILLYYFFLAKKHRNTLYYIIIFCKVKLIPFIKKTLLPIELILFLKPKLKKLKIRKHKNEKNSTSNTSFDN